jgi:hypothetical protein
MWESPPTSRSTSLIMCRPGFGLSTDAVRMVLQFPDRHRTTPDGLAQARLGARGPFPACDGVVLSAVEIRVGHAQRSHRPAPNGSLFGFDMATAWACEIACHSV